MLLGVRPELGDELVRDGHRLRIYVPFGTHWYEYSLRRLKENPKIAGYVAADVLRRLRADAARPALRLLVVEAPEDAVAAPVARRLDLLRDPRRGTASPASRAAARPAGG